MRCIHHTCPLIIHIRPPCMSCRHTCLHGAWLYPAHFQKRIARAHPHPDLPSFCTTCAFIWGHSPIKGPVAAKKNSRRGAADISRTPCAPCSNIGVCVSHGRPARKIGYFFRRPRTLLCAYPLLFLWGHRGEEAPCGVRWRLFFRSHRTQLCLSVRASGKPASIHSHVGSAPSPVCGLATWILLFDMRFMAHLTSVGGADQSTP